MGKETTDQKVVLRLSEDPTVVSITSYLVQTASSCYHSGNKKLFLKYSSPRFLVWMCVNRRQEINLESCKQANHAYIKWLGESPTRDRT